jgi:hypothetical protein
MPPTSQELSLLINPLVPESLQHNNRVSSSHHISLHPLPTTMPPSRTPANKNHTGLNPTSLVNLIPPRPDSRNPSATIRNGLHLLPTRHNHRLRAFPCSSDIPVGGQGCWRVLPGRRWRNRGACCAEGWDCQGCWEGDTEGRLEGCLVRGWCFGRGA